MNVVFVVLVRVEVARLLLVRVEGLRVLFRFVLAKREKCRMSVRGGLWEAR